MWHVVAAVVLVGLIAAVYGTSIEHEFVFDDTSLVVENPLVRLPLSRAHELLRSDGGGIPYRPLRVFSYMVDYRLAGDLDPRVFHASNLVYHAAATLALYALALKVIGSLAGGLSAAALFAVHPLGSEAVAYVSGRRDVLCALFVFLALLCWLRIVRYEPESQPPARSRPHRGRLGDGLAIAAMLVCSMLAIAAKETALVLPIVAFLFLVALRARPRPQRVSPRWDGRLGRPVAWIVLWGLAAVVLSVVLYAPQLGRIAERVGTSPIAPQPAFSLRVLGQYLWLAVWPARLSADYRRFAFPLPEVAIDPPAILFAVGIAVFVLTGVALTRRGSVAGVGILWFLVALLPVAQIVPYPEIVAENNAYLPLAGLALTVGAVVDAGARSRPTLAYGLAAVAIIALGVRSFDRVRDWRDSLTLWSATLDVAPRSLRAQYNFGIALFNDGRLLEAREALAGALALDPTERRTLLALGSLRNRLGDFDGAADLAARAVAQRRDTAALTLLGWSLLNTGDARGALAAFEEAIALGGDTEDAERGLRRVRGQAGRF
jgi:hypothetical protein